MLVARVLPLSGTLYKLLTNSITYATFFQRLGRLGRPLVHLLLRGLASWPAARAVDRDNSNDSEDRFQVLLATWRQTPQNCDSCSKVRRGKPATPEGSARLCASPPELQDEYERFLALLEKRAAFVLSLRKMSLKALFKVHTVGEDRRRAQVLPALCAALARAPRASAWRSGRRCSGSCKSLSPCSKNRAEYCLTL